MAGKRSLRSIEHVTHVEINRAGKQLARDGAGDDIARREFQQRMVAVHEALAGFASTSHAPEPRRASLSRKPRRAFERKGRRMELVELHIAECRAPGAIGHGDAIARCVGWDSWCRCRPGQRLRWR